MEVRVGQQIFIRNQHGKWARADVVKVTEDGFTVQGWLFGAKHVLGYTYDDMDYGWKPEIIYEVSSSKK